MSPSHVNDLIRKYLDRRATYAERAALEKLLVESPVAAEAFAEASRLDAWLTALLRGEKQIARTRAVFAEVAAAEARRRWRPVRAALGVAATVLLLTGGFFLYGKRTVQVAPTQPAPVAQNPNEVLSGRVTVDGQPVRSLPDGATIRVLEAATIRLGDGSRAAFEPASQVVLLGPANGMRQLVELVEGAGTFAVEKGEGQFQVETRLGRVTALGTEFSVRLLPADKLAVVVSSGLVQVEFAGKSHILTPGDSHVFAAKGEQPRRPKELRGVLRSIDAAQVSIIGPGDKRKEVSFPLTESVAVFIDGKLAQRGDLTRGTIVLLQQREAEGPVIVIRAEGQTVAGEVRSLDVDGRSITLASRKGEGKILPDQTYVLADDLEVAVDGPGATLDDIRPGTKVILKLSVTGKRVISITLGTKKDGERKGEK